MPCTAFTRPPQFGGPGKAQLAHLQVILAPPGLQGPLLEAGIALGFAGRLSLEIGHALGPGLATGIRAGKGDGGIIGLALAGGRHGDLGHLDLVFHRPVHLVAGDPVNHPPGVMQAGQSQPVIRGLIPAAPVCDSRTIPLGSSL